MIMFKEKSTIDEMNSDPAKKLHLLQVWLEKVMKRNALSCR